MYYVMGKRVVFGINDFFKIYFIVYVVRYMFVYIICLVVGMVCFIGIFERNGIFVIQYFYIFQMLLGNDIVGEYVVIFVDDFMQVRDEFFYFWDEVWVQVCLYIFNGIVVYY